MAFIGYILAFVLGVYVGVFAIIALKNGKPIKKQTVCLIEDRKNQLVERMMDIFEENSLDVNEISSILRTASVENDRTLKASNQIADLVLAEKLSITESTDLFNACYDALFFV